MFRVLAIAGVALAASASGAVAQMAEFESTLSYTTGSVVLGDGLATIQVPDGFRFLGPADAQRVVEDAWGNPPGEPPLGMLVPAGLSPLAEEGWAVIITFEEDGYVKDDDAADLDFHELLVSMQQAAEEENEPRVAAGYDPVRLVGWAEPPHYDPASHKLYWAKELQFGDYPENTLNYNVRVLGRRGVLVLNAVAGMHQLATVHAEVVDLLPSVEFNDGHRYADFVPSVDHVAAYGVAGLIAGKVALKAGFFKLILASLLAAKKLVIAAFVGLAAFFKGLMSKKKEPAESRG